MSCRSVKPASPSATQWRWVALVRSQAAPHPSTLTSPIQPMPKTSLPKATPSSKRTSTTWPRGNDKTSQGRKLQATPRVLRLDQGSSVELNTETQRARRCTEAPALPRFDANSFLCVPLCASVSLCSDSKLRYNRGSKHAATRSNLALGDVV